MCDFYERMDGCGFSVVKWMSLKKFPFIFIYSARHRGEEEMMTRGRGKPWWSQVDGIRPAAGNGKRERKVSQSATHSQLLTTYKDSFFFHFFKCFGIGMESCEWQMPSCHFIPHPSPHPRPSRTSSTSFFLFHLCFSRNRRRQRQLLCPSSFLPWLKGSMPPIGCLVWLSDGQGTKCTCWDGRRRWDNAMSKLWGNSNDYNKIHSIILIKCCSLFKPAEVAFFCRHWAFHFVGNSCQAYESSSSGHDNLK